MRFGCCGSMISPSTDPIGIEILEPMAAMGFDYIELSLAHLAALAEPEFALLEARLAESGLRCEACNNFFPPAVRLTGPLARLSAALEYAQGAMVRAARLGARVIVFGSSGAKNVPPGFPHEDAWSQIAELLRQLAPLAEQAGLTIVIEPISRPESNLLNRVEEGLLLARKVNHPSIQLLVDFYHLTIEAENPGVIARAGDTIRHLHFACAVGRTFPATPEAPYAAFFQQLGRIGYSGRCSLEGYTQDFTQDAPRALRVLRDIAGRMMECPS